MPFTRNQINLACQLKEASLAWTPGAGQYVYDRERRIKPGSPFQPQVYFFLDFSCFVEYFGGLSALRESMVWLPTWEQTAQQLRELRFDLRLILTRGRLESGTELDVAYEALLRELRGTSQ